MLDNKGIKTLIKQALEARPDLRDDDRTLLCYLYSKILGKANVLNESAFWLLQQYQKGNLPHAESVRRTRQKIQEKNPHLRGERYQERKKVLEKNVREEVRHWHE